MLPGTPRLLLTRKKGGTWPHHIHELPESYNSTMEVVFLAVRRSERHLDLVVLLLLSSSQLPTIRGE